MKKLISLFILCVASITVISAQSLTISLSGTNITCYNARNGSVNLTVSGGTSPYTFQWSTGATTEDISALSPSFYSVTVTDAASNTAADGVTLTEPSQITFSFTLSDYIVNGAHYHLSSYSWANGSITTSVSGGVTPYSYHWSNGATTANLSSLDAGSYKLTVTDASSCTKVSESQVLSKPDRSDWTITGNTGSNASTNFIGTTDNVDFVFKSNNNERLRIKANGDFKINSLSGSNAGMLYTDDDGYLWSSGKTIQPICPASPPIWRTLATPSTIYTCPLIKVGIGTSDVPSSYLLAVDGDIIAEKVNVQLSDVWPDYVFKKDYKLLPLESLEKFVNENHHLPEMPAADEIEKNGQDLGDIQVRLLKINEELTLRIIELNKRIEKLEKEKNK